MYMDWLCSEMLYKEPPGVNRKRRVTGIKDLGEMVVLVESWDGIRRQWSY